MSPIIDYNYEEIENNASKPLCNNNNNVIVLQPSFPLLQQQQPPHANASPCTESSMEKSPAFTLSTIDPNDIWHMWSVATKAKTSIPQGYRLENLSWRLWHRYVRDSASPQQNDAIQDPDCNLIGPREVLNQTNQNSAANLPKGEKTNSEDPSNESNSSTSPNSLGSKSEFEASNRKHVIGLLQTASVILTEIQQNIEVNSSNQPPTRKSNTSLISVSPPNSTKTSFYPKKESGTNVSSSSSASQQQESGIEMGATVPKSSSTKGSSRRKKNVQRFMQRYQNRLADISERITQSEASESEDYCPGSSEVEPQPVKSVIPKSTEPIDVKSGDTPVKDAEKTNKAHSNETYFKNGELKRISPMTTSDPQKPKVSLLTRLLDHNHTQVHRSMRDESFINELRFRHDSGTPLGQTPPTRPSAPMIFSDAQPEQEEVVEEKIQKQSRRSIVVAKNSNNALFDENQRRMSMDSNEGDFTSMMLW